MANANAPAHAQLHKEYIMFAPNHKPFILAGKETVLRAMTISLFQDDIDEFYTRQNQTLDSDATVIDMSNPAVTLEGLSKLLCRTLKRPSIGKADDLFATGLDSLSVLKLLASIRKSLDPTVRSKITAGTIYSNPTLEKLSNVLYRTTSLQNGPAGDETRQNIALMAHLVEKYTSMLPEIPHASRKNTTPAMATVLLTGSTGSLGSYLLEALMASKTVARIICLNRAIDGKQRQRNVNVERGLSTSWPAERVRFLHADLSRPKLGLQDAEYDELLQQTTHVIRKLSCDFKIMANVTRQSMACRLQPRPPCI